MAFKRKRLTRGKSRRNFNRGNGVHPKNGKSAPMRGGIRL